MILLWEEYSNKIYSIQTGVTNETQLVWQAPDWSSLFARNGYFVIADDALGENRPDGLPVPESNEVIYYNVVSAGKKW